LRYFKEKKKYEIEEEIAKGRIDEISDINVKEVRKFNKDSLDTLRDEEIKKRFN